MKIISHSLVLLLPLQHLLWNWVNIYIVHSGRLSRTYYNWPRVQEHSNYYQKYCSSLPAQTKTQPLDIVLTMHNRELPDQMHYEKITHLEQMEMSIAIAWITSQQQIPTVSSSHSLCSFLGINEWMDNSITQSVSTQMVKSLTINDTNHYNLPSQQALGTSQIIKEPQPMHQ